MKNIKYIIIFCLVLFPTLAFCQAGHPNPPTILSVSVIPDSNPVKFKIKWIPSDSQDVTDHIIYIIKNSITETLTTIPGAITNEADVVFPDHYTKPEKIRMAAVDNLMNKSKITDPHTTIFLNTENEKCKKLIKLKWTPYEAWKNSIKSYNIYRRTQTSTYTLLTSVSSTMLEYSDENIDFNNEYTYYVEAVNSDDNTATSNSSAKGLDSFIAPDYLYIEYVSVVGDNIEIKFIADNKAEISDYYVQRADSRDGGFKNIQMIKNDNNSVVHYTDTDVNPSESIYYYRIAAMNPCNYAINYSNVSSNILLIAKEDLELDHNISWSEYETWLGEVLNYKVFSVSEDNTSTEISTLSSSFNEFSYNIENDVYTSHKNRELISNKFCYYVKAYENSSENNLNVSGESKSNTVCIYEEPIVWLPTAINIYSVQEINREFKPTITFIAKDKYELKIYDRWGNLIFRSKDPIKGWNGILPNGSIAPSQIYIYTLKFYNSDNKEFFKSGTFFMDIN